MRCATPLSLLPSHQTGDAVAWRGQQAVSREAFLTHVAAVAARLPAQAYAINLCADRYLFTVGFAAALLRGQTNLLPPSRLAPVCEEIGAEFSRSYCLTDSLHPDLSLQQHPLDLPGDMQAQVPAAPNIASDHLAAIVFTSGSTGKARPNPKPWGSLVVGTHAAQRRFGVGRGYSLIATVPPQHMYGLETSVLLPLISGACVHAGRPFFPEDIRTSLAEMPAPRVLIGTPVHLRACVEARLQWPDVAFVISATAPLGSALAARVEREWNTRVLEIFGFSEAGSIASRRTVEGDRWHLYDGLTLEPRDEDQYVSGGHVPQPVPMSDVVERFPDGSFKLIGRHADLVNIAGKRASLSNLNHKLNEIEGVEDGTFVVPPESGTSVTRLAALVVAPALEERAVLAKLAQRIDPAFLPRPLRKVKSLPRNETGKLARAALLAMLERAGTDP